MNFIQILGGSKLFFCSHYHKVFFGEEYSLFICWHRNAFPIECRSNFSSWQKFILFSYFRNFLHDQHKLHCLPKIFWKLRNITRMMSPRLKYIDFTQTDVFFGQLCISIRVSDPHFFCGSGSGQKSSCGSGSGGIRGRGLGVKGKNEFFF